jgi:hypothetical protein
VQTRALSVLETEVLLRRLEVEDASIPEMRRRLFRNGKSAVSLAEIYQAMRANSERR